MQCMSVRSTLYALSFTHSVLWLRNEFQGQAERCVSDQWRKDFLKSTPTFIFSTAVQKLFAGIIFQKENPHQELFLRSCFPGKIFWKAVDNVHQLLNRDGFKRNISKFYRFSAIRGNHSSARSGSVVAQRFDSTPVGIRPKWDTLLDTGTFDDVFSRCELSTGASCCPRNTALRCERLHVRGM